MLQETQAWAGSRVEVQDVLSAESLHRYCYVTRG